MLDGHALDAVVNLAVQHSDAADPGAEGDAHPALVVVGRHGDLAGAPRPMGVWKVARIFGVPGGRVRVSVIPTVVIPTDARILNRLTILEMWHVTTEFAYIVFHKIIMIMFQAIVQDCHLDASSINSRSVAPQDIQVQLGQVPHCPRVMLL